MMHCSGTVSVGHQHARAPKVACRNFLQHDPFTLNTRGACQVSAKASCTQGWSMLDYTVMRMRRRSRGYRQAWPPATRTRRSRA